MDKKWDILIKGGTVVDPSQGLHAIRDVGLTGDKVAVVSEGLDASLAESLVDGVGKIVTAGLVDIHVHTFVGQLGVSADETSLARGTTTVLDAGSATPEEFPLYRRYCIDQDRTRTFALIRMPDPHGPKATSISAMVKQIDANRDVVIGVKYHHSQGYESLMLAREAADFAGTIMMFETYGPPLRHLLEYAKTGDVFTHFFHGQFRCSMFDKKGRVLPELMAGLERGIRLDVGHGERGFSFRAIERALDQGVKPFTISTDLHGGNVDGPVYDMRTTVSKFMALGFSLDEVILLSTHNPAIVLGKEGELGTLKEGAAADVVVWHLEEGEFGFMDVLHEVRKGQYMLVPQVIIRDGVVYEGKPYQSKKMTHEAQYPPGFLNIEV
jgi:dihydroorotase